MAIAIDFTKLAQTQASNAAEIRAQRASLIDDIVANDAFKDWLADFRREDSERYEQLTVQAGWTERDFADDYIEQGYYTAHFLDGCYPAHTAAA